MKLIYKSMIPARPGDRAIFLDGEEEISEPLVMWAIIQEDNDSLIVGLVLSELGIASAEESINFVGYVDARAGTPQIHELCKLMARADRAPRVR
jgi:hypothetical protein